MKAAIIVFPGSNCDRDVRVALENNLGIKPEMIWHKETELPVVDLIVVPGGFSYGDYLRAGCMAANSPVMREVVAKADKGLPILGICNGFQILCESELLPGALLRNAGLNFVCREVYLKVTNNRTIFTNGYDLNKVIRLPVAHHDGNYFADAKTLKKLEEENKIAFRYCLEDGDLTDDANPNGSAKNIAGILNDAENVLGMMPHPERLAEPALGGIDGRILFKTIAKVLGN